MHIWTTFFCLVGTVAWNFFFFIYLNTRNIEGLKFYAPIWDCCIIAASIISCKFKYFRLNHFMIGRSSNNTRCEWQRQFVAILGSVKHWEAKKMVFHCLWLFDDTYELYLNLQIWQFKKDKQTNRWTELMAHIHVGKVSWRQWLFFW